MHTLANDKVSLLILDHLDAVRELADLHLDGGNGLVVAKEEDAVDVEAGYVRTHARQGRTEETATRFKMLASCSAYGMRLT